MHRMRVTKNHGYTHFSFAQNIRTRNISIPDRNISWIISQKSEEKASFGLEGASLTVLVLSVPNLPTMRNKDTHHVRPF